MKKLLILCSLALALTSCQKEIHENDVVTGGGSGGTGGGPTGTDTYQPVTKDSWWKYKDPSNGSETLMTSLGTTKASNGKTFRVFSSLTTGQPAQEALYYIANNEYTLINSSISGGAAVSIEIAYLNDKEPVGFTFTRNAGTINGIAVKTITKIIEKGISKTVAGKTYKDVIHTEVQLQYDLGIGGFITAGTYQVYVAKNIGVVLDVYTLDLFGQSQTSTVELVDYSIK